MRSSNINRTHLNANSAIRGGSTWNQGSKKKKVSKFSFQAWLFKATAASCKDWQWISISMCISYLSKSIFGSGNIHYGSDRIGSDNIHRVGIRLYYP
ncbi:hypothetical protein NC653_014648 [Populus alba x Populus x berolinensis]|uniref:Uncharacterized protein n=1 Tax=Populus alba x Populus x berolinensis TaxID=444605 RepID=A0AAD6W582_9ROSI|nr:hypothetical protein NC653_014648 [Populus alba x Populus x berolinensis]